MYQSGFSKKLLWRATLHRDDIHKLLTEFCSALYTIWRTFGSSVPLQMEVPSPDFSFEVIINLNVLFSQVEVDFLRIYDRSGFHFHYNPNDIYTFGDETILRDVCYTVNLVDFLLSVLYRYLSYVTDLIEVGELLRQEGFLNLNGSDMFVIGGEL